MPASVRRLLASSVAVLVLAGACTSDPPDAEESAVEAPPFCPLGGGEVPPGIDGARPAVAIKVENNPSVYPLSGLDDAELVYEEVVEGGITRFMAFYHCTDSKKVGPLRSARVVDPAIMIPITRILAAAGGNAVVRKALKDARVLIIDEDAAGKAMRRIPRLGVSFEHTLFGDSAALRKLGKKRYNRPPPSGLFEFGPADGGKRVRTVTIKFSPAVTVSYRWSKQGWRRFDRGEPFRDDGGEQVVVDNVLIEEHRVKYSRTLVDVAGNRSIEIKDVTGSGRAALLRDGRVVLGRWKRESADAPVRFVTRSGEAMMLAPGTTWIALVPDNKGDVKGDFSFK